MKEVYIESAIGRWSGYYSFDSSHFSPLVIGTDGIITLGGKEVIYKIGINNENMAQLFFEWQEIADQTISGEIRFKWDPIVPFYIDIINKEEPSKKNNFQGLRSGYPLESWVGHYITKTGQLSDSFSPLVLHPNGQIAIAGSFIEFEYNPLENKVSFENQVVKSQTISGAIVFADNNEKTIFNGNITTKAENNTSYQIEGIMEGVPLSYWANYYQEVFPNPNVKFKPLIVHNNSTVHFGDKLLDFTYDVKRHTISFDKQTIKDLKVQGEIEFLTYAERGELQEVECRLQQFPGQVNQLYLVSGMPMTLTISNQRKLPVTVWMKGKVDGGSTRDYSLCSQLEPGKSLSLPGYQGQHFLAKQGDRIVSGYYLYPGNTQWNIIPVTEELDTSTIVGKSRVITLYNHLSSYVELYRVNDEGEAIYYYTIRAKHKHQLTSDQGDHWIVMKRGRIISDYFSNNTSSNWIVEAGSHTSMGITVSKEAYLYADPIPAYNVGIGDFTVASTVITQTPGTVVSRIGTSQGNNNGGFLLVLNKDTSIKFSTCDGNIVTEAISAATKIFDGECHSIAGVRKDGKLKIFLDAVEIQTKIQNDKGSPLNVNNNQPLYIGYTQLSQEPFPDFEGKFMNAGLWNRALSIQEIHQAMFEKMDAIVGNMLGYWPMNNTLKDSSVYANTLKSIGSMGFTDCFSWIWTYGENQYTFCQVETTANDLVDSAETYRTQTIHISEGTPALYAIILNDSKKYEFPDGVVLEIEDSSGRKYNTNIQTDNEVVYMKNNSLFTLCVSNPVSGAWKVRIRSKNNISFFFQLQTIPSRDAADTALNTLVPLFQKNPKQGSGGLMSEGISELAVYGFWGKFVKIVAFSGAIAVAAAVIVATGGFAAPAIAMAGIAAYAATSTALIAVEIVNDKDSAIHKFIDSFIGGQDNGSASLIVDGRDYFAIFRNILLAVKAGHYEANGITIPQNPTFENLIKGISEAGQKVSVLMWDTSSLYHMMETNDWAKYYIRRFVSRGDAKRNKKTAEALKNLPNVTVNFEDYCPFRSNVLSTNSQHQKIAIVSVNNVKCALVGGFNIITPDYRDDPDHPMNDKSNFHTWHDTAVLLQGPIAAVVEKEFDRRWAKAKNPTPKGSGTYAKIACWQINHDSCFDSVDTCSGSQPSKIPYQDPINHDPQYPIDVLITDSQDTVEPVTQIKNKILEKIRTANSYIYFENFTFHDADLVKEINHKLKNSSDAFRCIINIPYPTNGDDHADQLGQFYMSRLAFAAIVLSTNDWTELRWTDRSKKEQRLADGDDIHYKVTPQECISCAVDIPEGKLLEYVTFRYTLKKSGQCYQFPLRDCLDDVIIASKCKLILTSPVRYFKTLNPNEKKFQLPGLSPNFRRIYIHSKLALFDDNYAIVGSGNFDTRSLNWDGECSVGINSNVKAKDIRTTIFKHWGADTAQNWHEKMNEFVQNPSERVGVVPLPIITLSIQPPSFLWSCITALYDPSDLT